MVFDKESVFIAGGISNCPDWQSDIARMFNVERFDVINPRRIGGFDITGLTAEEQIAWEHRALNVVDACIFWFPKETLCPITLLECGRMVERARHKSLKLVIGWHPDYQRALDLKVQLELECLDKERLLHSGPGWADFCAAIQRTWG